MEPRDIPGSNLPLPREQRSRKGFSKQANCKSLGSLSCLPSQLLTVPSQREAKENSFPRSLLLLCQPSSQQMEIPNEVEVAGLLFLKSPTLRLPVVGVFKGDSEDKEPGYFAGLISMARGPFLLSGAEGSEWMI